MAAKKLIYIASFHKGHKTIYGGTLDYLLNNVFGYTLECGNSWNSKIPRYPKSAKSLVKALNDSADVCNRYHDFYDLSSEEEFKNHDGRKSMMEAMA
jgi:hypothetical protein